MERKKKCFLGMGTIVGIGTVIYRYQRKRKLSQHYFQLLEQFGDVTMAEYQIHKDILVFSSCARKMLRLDKLVYKNFSNCFDDYSFIYPQDKMTIIQYFNHLMQQKSECKYEIRMLFKDGTYQWCLIHFLLIYDIYHQPKSIVFKITDISKHKATVETLEAKTRHDAMTGLYLKNAFQEAVSQLLEEEEKGCFLILDLDNFKTINDTFGHVVGDQCLVELGEILKTYFRKDDIVGRYGGDEFEIFMRHMIDIEAIQFKACQIMKAIETSTVFKDLKIEVTCSIGAVIVDHYMSYQEVFQRADLALYCSKYQGKNQCHIDYIPE